MQLNEISKGKDTNLISNYDFSCKASKSKFQKRQNPKDQIPKKLLNEALNFVFEGKTSDSDSQK